MQNSLTFSCIVVSLNHVGTLILIPRGSLVLIATAVTRENKDIKLNAEMYEYEGDVHS